MTNDEPPLSGCKFAFEGGINNTYYFTTGNSVAYKIEFKPTPYAFGQPTPYDDHIFELILKVIDSPEGVRPPYGPLTAPTVAAIPKDFYNRSGLTVTIYICDTSDQRQKARWYKFNRWYDYFNANDYERIDRAVLDQKDGVLYHCAAIFKAGNPYRTDIFIAFNRLMDGYNEPK